LVPNGTAPPDTNNSSLCASGKISGGKCAGYITGTSDPETETKAENKTLVTDADVDKCVTGKRFQYKCKSDNKLGNDLANCAYKGAYRIQQKYCCNSSNVFNAQFSSSPCVPPNWSM
jgi:hypothetical protein